MDATAWKQPLVRGCLGALLLYAAVVVVLTAVLLAAGAHREVMDALLASAIGGAALTFGLLDSVAAIVPRPASWALRQALPPSLHASRGTGPNA